MAKKFDALEAAKQIGKRPSAPPMTGARVPEAQVQAAPVPTPVPTDAAPAVTFKTAPKYRVKTGQRVSLYSRLLFLPAGEIISEESYGPGIIARLEEQGVELEALSSGG